MKKIVLKTGDYFVGKNIEQLITRGIGSCVVICFFEKRLKISAMAHMLLPSQNGASETKIGNSPDTAIPRMLEEIEKLGGNRINLTVHLVGAGNMFPESEKGMMTDIGANIFKATKKELQKYLLDKNTIEEIGGNLGRSVIFDGEKGKLEVTNVNGEIVNL